MLNEAIGNFLPSALAVALSPIPVVAIVVVLGGPTAPRAGPALALGWVAGLIAVSVVVVLVAGGAGAADQDEPGVSWFRIAVGLLFLAMAAKQWRKRPRSGHSPEMPNWIATVGSASPARAVVLGATLSAANPKNVALTLTAAASIAEAGLDTSATAVAIGTYVALGSFTVVGAVLFYLGAGEAAARPLAAIKQFMGDNNAVIMTVVLLLLAAKLLGDGIAGL